MIMLHTLSPVDCCSFSSNAHIVRASINFSLLRTQVAPLFGQGMVGTISVGFGVTNVISSVVLGRLTDAWGWTLPLGIGVLAQVCLCL